MRIQKLARSLDSIARIVSCETATRLELWAFSIFACIQKEERWRKFTQISLLFSSEHEERLPHLLFQQQQQRHEILKISLYWFSAICCVHKRAGRKQIRRAFVKNLKSCKDFNLRFLPFLCSLSQPRATPKCLLSPRSTWMIVTSVTRQTNNKKKTREYSGEEITNFLTSFSLLILILSHLSRETE